MCITSEEVKADQEMMVWDILCDKCEAKAETLLEKKEARLLFDIDKEEYGFCPECAVKINDAFDRLEEVEIGGEIP